jgi:FKBP-type peptidyl-prolyl cis-trans isomerase FkpA
LSSGITPFKEAGTGLLLVSSHLGYGFTHYSSIPGGYIFNF